MVDLRNEESVFICFLHLLGTSTIRTDFINSIVDLRINESKSNRLR